jgi:hypothetical protein
VTLANVGGTFEGTSGNPGHSSAIQGVISNWGALGDTLWMRKGDVPVYCVHGTADSTVFYDSIPADGPFRYGSKFIYAAAQYRGIESGLRLFANTGHTLDNNSTKQDSAIKDFSAWLFTILKNPVTGVRQGERSEIPDVPTLQQNYPNPFNPFTIIKYTVAGTGGWGLGAGKPGAGTQGPGVSKTRLVIYDMLGREVATLVNEPKPPGNYVVTFDGSNLSSGVYVCCLTTGATAQTRKMVLLR